MDKLILALFLCGCGIGAAATDTDDDRADDADEDRADDSDEETPGDPTGDEDGVTGPCASAACDTNALCSGLTGVAVCTCMQGFTGDGMTCVPTVDPCVASGECPDGVWIQRTLPGFDTTQTILTVLSDPARPSDFYAFTGSNNGPAIRVYRSTDYGETWELRNTTSEPLGNPWGASIDPNPYRDPGTPPTMWAPSGYGSYGAWKSEDGGATWQRSAGADAAFGPYNPYGLTDLYHIQILPDDPPNHVLATYHYAFKNSSEGGIGETWDGGETWVIHEPPAGIGTSHYVIPISATTWALVAQDNENRNGIWRTTTAGRVGGTAAAKFRDGTISIDAWERAGGDDIEHVHGSHQNVVLDDGTIFVTGWVSGAVSRDAGATWERVTDGFWGGAHFYKSSAMSNVAATTRYVYTNFFLSPTLARAPRDNLVGKEYWDVEYCETPAGMTNGGAPFGMASSFNPSTGKWVIVAGTIAGTLWTFVEPLEEP